MPVPIKVLIVYTLYLSVLPAGNDSFHTMLFTVTQQRICVIGLVCQQLVRIKPPEQLASLAAIR